MLCLSQRNLFSIITVVLMISLSLPVMAENSPTTLEKRLRQMEQRIKKLESENIQLNKSLDKPYISNDEPELSARLKAVESLANSHRKAARTIETLQGIEASAGFTMAAQGVSGEPAVNHKPSQLNYRGDVTVSLPAGSIGSAEGFLFTHFRMGQGTGLENPGGAFASVNSTSFQRPGTDTSDSTVLLAQLWYQLKVPLPLGGNSDLSRQHLEFNFGKIDPFVFFDQNTIADDETQGFINQAFLHNPLLDVGGDIGVDDFGFTPGFRLAWVNNKLKPEQYTLSIGVFGAGEGASFENSLSRPFVIVQATTHQNPFVGLSGNYRVYYWQNGRGENLYGERQTHAGLGLSIDQKVADYATLFARYGQQTEGQVKFDRALTIGVDVGGSYWNRGNDAIGLAVGGLFISDAYKQASTTPVGFHRSGAEQLVELFYRYRINRQFTVSPDLQFIRHPGGNQLATTLTAYGLRTQLNF